jgi:hypothetical protein
VAAHNAFLAFVRAHRRQLGVIGSGVSVVALVTATALGVHSWRNAATRNSVSGGSSADPLASQLPTSPPPASPPPASPDGFAPSASATLADSPPADPSPSPSTSDRPTQLPTDPSSGVTSQISPKVDIKVSPSRVLFGQQVRIVVTILNAGRLYFPPARLDLGTMVPTETFHGVPPGCTDEPQLGGVVCSTSGLRFGQRTSFVFMMTPGIGPSPGDGVDNVSGTLQYLDSHGQPQQVLFQQQFTVVVGAASSPPPTSAAPSSTPSG